jgi:hypothetical protein
LEKAPKRCHVDDGSHIAYAGQQQPTPVAFLDIEENDEVTTCGLQVPHELQLDWTTI